MIKGLHGMFYTPKAEEARQFLAEKLGFDHVDAGNGWLVFDVPDAEFGVHPIDDNREPTSGLSFWCDDIEQTVADLEDEGVGFVGPVEDKGWGLVTRFELPGGLEVQLYEPRYEQP